MSKKRHKSGWILPALVAAALCLPALVSAQPDWVTGLGESAQYPSAQFLTGFGQSHESQEVVDDRARADLARQIQVSVHSVVEDTLSEEVSKCSVFTRCVSDVVLEGVVPKRYAAEGTYYTLAVLDRAKAGALLNKKMEDHHASAREYYAQAQGYEVEGMYDLALRSYFLAQESCTKAISQEMIYRVVRTDLETAGEEMLKSGPTLPEIESRIERIASRMRLSAASGDGQSIGYGVEPEPVCARLTVGEGDAAHPVAGVPVAFSIESGTGKVEDTVRTDQRGRACAWVYDPRSDIKHRLVVRAKVAPETLVGQVDNPYSRSWTERMGQLTCTFTFRFEEVSAEEVADLDEAYRRLAYRLSEHVVLSQKILMGAFTYRTSGIGGECAEHIRDGLSEAMTDLGMSVSQPEEMAYATRSVQAKGLRGYAEPALAETYAKQMGRELALTGTYWDLGDEVEIVARLAPASGQGTVVTKRIKFPDQVLPPGMRLKPEHLEHAQHVEQIFEHGRPISSGFDVKLWLDRPEGSTYVEGEEMVVYFEANRDCHLRLIYHDAYGDNYEIFPNGCDSDNFAQANILKSIGDPQSPIAFVVSGPPFGPERVWVHASTAPLTPLDGERVGDECPFLKLTGTTEEIVSITRGVPTIVKRPSGPFLKAEDSVAITTVPRR